MTRKCLCVRAIEDLASLQSQIVELRLDYFSMEIEKIADLQKTHTLILTNHKNPEELLLLKGLNPDFIDLDWSISKELFKCFKQCFPKTKFIGSFHNYEGLDFPKEFPHPFDIKKHALTAETPLDGLKILDLQKKSPQDLFLGMGTNGAMTRFYAEKVGSLWVYLSASGKKPAILGQVPIDQFQFKRGLYGLVGHPVCQSISDRTHNPVLEKVNAAYFKFDVTDLEDFIACAQSVGVEGISVTMPYKRKILSLIENPAHLIAVNTLVLKNGKYEGFNTDGIGALSAIEEHFSAVGKKIFILGNGGSALAIKEEAEKRGAFVKLFSRQELSLLTKEYDLLINATPSDLPVDPDLLTSSIMDLTTKPKETRLIKEAKKRGCKVIYGYELFAAQAELQFELWGIPCDSIKEASEQFLVNSL